MGIVRLPMGRGRGDLERPALRRGLATSSLVRTLRVVAGETPDPPAQCAACAGPIEFGAVARGGESYCSIECALGGGRPA